jgi:hypothetical protein
MRSGSVGQGAAYALGDGGGAFFLRTITKATPATAAATIATTAIRTRVSELDPDEEVWGPEADIVTTAPAELLAPWSVAVTFRDNVPAVLPAVNMTVAPFWAEMVPMEVLLTDHS